MVSSASISVVNMSYFHGLELAMNAGLDISIGDFVFEFDNTELSYDASVVMEVYRRSLQGYDIVSACPDKKERITSRLFYSVFAHYSDTQYKMTAESFRILSRRVINRINAMNKTVPYRKAIYASCGLKSDSIIYSVVGEESSIDKRESVYRSRLAIDTLILFTEMGYRFSKSMTIIMMVFSVIMFVYSIVVYITSTPVAGWTTTILFLSVAFGGLFGILTVVIKYLQLLVELVFKCKHYSYEGIEKLTR